MNCKPGDLAVIVADCPSTGWLVDVLYAAPGSAFITPEGYSHIGCESGEWVCRSLGSPFSVPVGLRQTSEPRYYAAIADWGLRPIRGEPESTTHDEPIAETA